MNMRKVLILLNQQSGAIAQANGHDITQSILNAFRSENITPDLEIHPGNRLPQAARRVFSDGYDALVVGGGDGTIGSLAGILAGTKIPLGILPLGTYNHFARDLKTPIDLSEAIHCLAHGQPTAVDIADVNGHFFVNNSSIGAYPRMVAEREELRQQTGWSKKVAMTWAAFKVLLQPPLIHAHLELDGKIIKHTTPFVFVGNNIYSPAFGAGELRSCINAGRLCVFTTRCAGLRCFLWLAWQALHNRLLDAEEFDSWSVREARIHTHKKHLRVALDGEVIRLDSPLHYRIHPGALQVITPPAP